MSKKNAFILLQFIVVLWGFTAILGALITYESVPLVWLRLLLVNISLGLYLLLSKQQLKLTKKLFWQLLGVGFIVGIHWLFFYGGIKISNISVTLIAFSSGTLFTALIEPLFYKRKINGSEIIIGLAICCCISSIAMSDLDNVKNPILGVLFGAMAALTAALFSTFNGVLIKKSNTFTITFIQLLSAFFWVSIALFVFFEVPENLLTPSQSDFWYLMVLSILCTAVPFIIAVEIMKQLTPFTVNLSLNMEIVYAIILAYFIFGEEEKMSIEFYLSSGCIVLLILLNEIIKKKKAKRKQKLN
jgi:drug/metabolite transporter (DMT)-like permease